MTPLRLTPEDIERLPTGATVLIAIEGVSSPRLYTTHRRLGNVYGVPVEGYQRTIQLHPPEHPSFIVTTIAPPATAESYVWWCACGAASVGSYKGPGAPRICRKAWRRHQGTKPGCVSSGDYGPISHEPLRKEWATRRFRLGL